MTSLLLPGFRVISIAAFCIILSGCTRSEPVSLADHLQSLEEDIRILFQTKPIEAPITLYDAMARALKYNMDHRLAAIEEEVADGNVTLSRLNMLPELNAKANAIGRSKSSASSSRSVITGVQSLEPSVSSDKDYKTASLEASWNILDAGLSFVQSKQESSRSRIARERKRKVVHNIIQDVRYAYWRAAGANEMLDDIDRLLKKGNHIIYKTRKAEKAGVLPKNESFKTQAQLLSSMDELMTMRCQLSFARIELSSLMNLPPSTDFKLPKSEKKRALKSPLPRVNMDMKSMEKLALLVRPETREEYLKERVAQTDISMEVLRTFPGAEFILSENYNNNQFSEHNKWIGFSAGLTQNIMKVFTLPARVGQAKNQKKLGDFRRYALTLAVMAQVHISKTRLNLAKDRYKLLKRIHTLNNKMFKIALSKKEANAVREEIILEAEMGMLLSRIRTYIAFAEMQNAHGQLVNSLGIDLVPADALNTNIDVLAAQLKKRLAQVNGRSFEDIFEYIVAENPELGKAFASTFNTVPPLPKRKPVKAERAPHKNIVFKSFKGLYTEVAFK